MSLDGVWILDYVRPSAIGFDRSRAQRSERAHGTPHTDPYVGRAETCYTVQHIYTSSSVNSRPRETAAILNLEGNTKY